MPDNNTPTDDWQQLVSDVRWAKEQGWKVLQWTVLLQAAIYAASTQIGEVPVWVYFVLTLIVAFAASAYLIDLHIFAKKSRTEALTVLPDYVPWGHSRKRGHHAPYLSLQLAVVVGATIIVVVGVL